MAEGEALVASSSELVTGTPESSVGIAPRGLSGQLQASSRCWGTRMTISGILTSCFPEEQ
ncbi:hypothetical protein GGH92_004261, partial [Coemansia sp. RSA 2673]